MNLHTSGNAVPPLDDELAGVLDDISGVHPGVDLIRDGIRLISLDRLDADKTQTILATLAGAEGVDVLTVIGLLVQRLANADSNPGLRHLPPDQQKNARHFGELTAYTLSDPELHQTASEAAAAIDGV